MNDTIALSSAVSESPMTMFEDYILKLMTDESDEFRVVKFPLFNYPFILKLI